MIQYTSEEIIEAIQNFDTDTLTKIVTDVTSQFWNKVSKHIPYNIRCDKELADYFIKCTTIPYISIYDVKMDVVSIRKDEKYFTCRFSQCENGNEPVVIHEILWKVEDFLNEQRWIDNINYAIRQMKCILDRRIKRDQKLFSHLPVNELTIEDF